MFSVKRTYYIVQEKFWINEGVTSAADTASGAELAGPKPHSWGQISHSQ